MKSLFEQFGGTYREENGYLIPNLSLPDEEQHTIGIWGSGVRWTPLSKTEEPTESADETNDTGGI